MRSYCEVMLGITLYKQIDISIRDVHYFCNRNGVSNDDHCAILSFEVDMHNSSFALFVSSSTVGCFDAN